MERWDGRLPGLHWSGLSPRTGSSPYPTSRCGHYLSRSLSRCQTHYCLRHHHLSRPVQLPPPPSWLLLRFPPTSTCLKLIGWSRGRDALRGVLADVRLPAGVAAGLAGICSSQKLRRPVATHTASGRVAVTKGYWQAPLWSGSEIPVNLAGAHPTRPGRRPRERLGGGRDAGGRCGWKQFAWGVRVSSIPDLEFWKGCEEFVLHHFLALLQHLPVILSGDCHLSC